MFGSNKGVNIAGADIGIETDSCLRVSSRTQGAYLPDASNGGFVVFEQTDDTSTRLAVAITDRKAIANTDGIFFSAQLEVLCDTGSPTVTVNVAELSAYRDPTAEQIELIAYMKDDGSLDTVDAQLSMSAAEAQQPIVEAPTGPTGGDNPQENMGGEEPAGTMGEDGGPEIIRQLSELTNLSPNILYGIIGFVVLLLLWMLTRMMRRK